MIYRTFNFIILTFLYYSSETVDAHPDASNEITTKCEEMDKPGWSILSLANVTLDEWPWKCLNQHYSDVTLGEAVLKFSSDGYDAAAKGYIGFVQYYVVKKGANLYDYNEQNVTALYLAVKNGHLNVVKYLAFNDPDGVSYSCSENRFSEWNKKVLLRVDSWAAFFGQLDVFKYLFNTQWSDGSRSERLRSAVKAAAAGGQLNMFKYLNDVEGYTMRPGDEPLLSMAAATGNVDLIKYLIFEKNVTAYKSDSSSEWYENTKFFERVFSCAENLTALCYAAAAGKLDAVKFFVDTLNYPLKDDSHRGQPIVEAIKGGSLPVVKYMIEEKGADINDTFSDYSLLQIAAASGQLAIVKYLVEQKHMDIEWTDDFGKKAIDMAIFYGELDVVKYLAGEKNAGLELPEDLNRAILRGYLDVVKYLVDLKMASCIDRTSDPSGMTASTLSAHYGQLDILKFLVEDRHANISVVDKQGYNLLHQAASGGEILYKSNYVPIFKYLIEEKGFDVHAKTAWNETALDLARLGRGLDEASKSYLSEKFGERETTASVRSKSSWI